MKLPLRTRAYFRVRLCGILTVRALIRFGTWANWAWLVFNLMALQRRLGWRYEV